MSTHKMSLQTVSGGGVQGGDFCLFGSKQNLLHLMRLVELQLLVSVLQHREHREECASGPWTPFHTDGGLVRVDTPDLFMI